MYENVYSAGCDVQLVWLLFMNTEGTEMSLCNCYSHHRYAVM